MNVGTMREFLICAQHDIDVYNDVTDEEGVCYCPPIYFTKDGENEFEWVLDNVMVEVDEDGETATIICDDDEENAKWQKKKKESFRLLWAIAGYCADEDWNRWFSYEEV